MPCVVDWAAIAGDAVEDLVGLSDADGVGARVAQRLLALAAAIWHNRATGQPITRSLIAYDH
jgi:hypothetical protein